MPQFDFAHVFWPQVIWLGVFFALLYFGVVRTTLPRLSRVMDQRADRISGDLAKAQGAKDEADRLAERHEAEMTEARQHARGTVASAKADAALATEARLAKAGQAVELRLAEADARIAAALGAAKADLAHVAAELTMAVMVRVGVGEPTKDEAAAAVEAVAA